MRSQLKDIASLAGNQRKSMAQLVEQKKASQGANIGTDTVSLSLQNTIKSTAGVMDSVFQSLQCGSTLPETEEEQLAQENQNAMMQKVQSITKDMGGSLAANSLPNEKPAGFESKTSASTTSTLTGKKMSQYLVTSLQP
jgi:hypothetical protein